VTTLAELEQVLAANTVVSLGNPDQRFGGEPGWVVTNIDACPNGDDCPAAGCVGIVRLDLADFSGYLDDSGWYVDEVHVPEGTAIRGAA
jgi:hypothetical protein